MTHKIQHLRGTAAQWSENDITPAEGELALLKKADGRMQLRIGDGSHAFSLLPPIGERKIDAEALPFGTLEAGCEYRMGECDAIEVYFPDAPADDYYAVVTFDSGEEATFFYVDEDCLFSGDDTEGGLFLPTEKKHYTLLFWYDGKKQALVRAVPRA